ncbi:hypothetical protein [Pedobacter sp. SYSU D00535]|uniref:hypothetical protein n=1 Tax=Pedobacter sp. SYSU D00535 TaxID=2810308 RepID=UPI001A9751CC|nr:hypothetical protein [Pedobacter sp. SYSU D00535]
MVFLSGIKERPLPRPDYLPMKNLFKLFASFLLLVNGICAMYIGWELVLYPDGSTLQLPLSLLSNSPFQDYLLPGIFLFTTNGLFSFFVLGTMLVWPRNSPKLIIFQGIVLTISMLAQSLYRGELNFLQLLYLFSGLLLILSGFVIKRIEEKEFLRRHIFSRTHSLA